MPLQMRAAVLERIAPTDGGGEDLLRVTWTTGAQVRRYDWENDRMYDEELQVDSSSVKLGRLNSGSAPVLDSHNASSIDDVKGIVRAGSAKLDGGLGTADIQLDTGPENESIVRKVKAGIVRNVSIGYRVNKFQMITRDGNVPIYRATDWEPYEISLVPIGADAGAGIRSAPSVYPCELIPTNPKETRMPENETTLDPNANSATDSTETTNDNPAGETRADTTADTSAADNARAEGVFAGADLGGARWQRKPDDQLAAPHAHRW